MDEDVPPFLDFYPADVDGALSLLLEVSTPGTAKREAAPAQALAGMRFATLDWLEQHQARERARGHQAAERIVRAAAAAGRPFGLYLRNFVLGSTATSGGHDEHGSQRVITFVYPLDELMQSWLVERAGAKVPFVGIGNRAAVFGALPRFELSYRDWEAGAGTLIAHAGAIVLFFLTTTPGVAIEIDMLRAAGAQERTLVVVQDDDPRDDALERVVRNVYGDGPEAAADGSSVPEPSRRQPPEDFPHRVHVGDASSAIGDALGAAIDDLVRRARPARPGDLAPLPRPDGPSADALAMAHRLAQAEYQAGGEAWKRGEGIAAEDAAMRSIVFSHWARDPLARALAFSLLGSVERNLLHDSTAAVAAFSLALDLFESIADSSPSARAALPHVVEGLAKYLDELGDHGRAELIRGRLPAG